MAGNEHDNEKKIGLPIHTCPGKIKVPTEEEQEALKKLREIKAEVRKKKACMAQLSSSGKETHKDQIDALEAELEELREQWNIWERKRQEAAKERMILLGHDQPTDLPK